MREIKFRAWYDKSQTWVYFDITKGFANKESLHIYQYLVSTNITFYQYTGLKDKNGKEIFESDIVRCIGSISVNNATDEIREIEYNDMGQIEPFDGSDYFWYPDEVEIIGNKFENGDLLDS